MCQPAGTMLGDVDQRVDRHVLRNTQRKLKMEAVLGSAGSGANNGMRTPSPQRKSILSRSQSYSADKENNVPGTPPGISIISRLAASAGSSSPSTPSTPVMGSTDAKQSLRYTSLAELVVAIPNSVNCRSDSFGAGSQGGAPRTPMKDALVEKAVRAYLQPSDSFSRRTSSSGWGKCLPVDQLVPSCISKLAIVIPNPLQFFCCVVHALTLYTTRQQTPMPTPSPLEMPLSLIGKKQTNPDDEAGEVIPG